MPLSRAPARERPPCLKNLISRGVFSKARMTRMSDPDPTERFDWLRDKRHRRAALLEVQNALLREWVIDGDRRAALTRELNALLGAADLSERERVRIGRIFQALDSGPPRRTRLPRQAAPDRP